MPLFLFRTAFEDRTLRRELEGYEEYAQRTRYRLVPGCGRQVDVPKRLWALRSPGEEALPQRARTPEKRGLTPGHDCAMEVVEAI